MYCRWLVQLIPFFFYSFWIVKFLFLLLDGFVFCLSSSSWNGHGLIPLICFRSSRGTVIRSILRRSGYQIWTHPHASLIMTDYGTYHMDDYSRWTNHFRVPDQILDHHPHQSIIVPCHTTARTNLQTNTCTPPNYDAVYDDGQQCYSFSHPDCCWSQSSKESFALHRTIVYSIDATIVWRRHLVYFGMCIIISCYWWWALKILLVNCDSNRKTEREEEVESSPSVIINKEKEKQQFDFSSCRDNRCDDACVWARLG